jgi:hypothetical protein
MGCSGCLLVCFKGELVSPLLLLGATLDPGSGSQSSSNTPDLVVLTLSVAAGILALAKAVADYFQTRTKSLPALSAQTPVVHELETKAEKYLDAKELRSWKWTFAIVVIINLFLLSLTLWAALSTSVISVGVTMLLAAEFGIGVAFGVFFIQQLWGKGPEEPVHQTEAEIVVKGSQQTIIYRCQRALVAVQAWKAEGVKVTESDGALTLQGGTGPWPKKMRGQRILIEIRPDEDKYRAKLRSSTYWPSLWASRRDKQNIRRLIEELLS